MGISPEVEAQYENNRLRMMQVNRGFRRFMWFSIILGALIFSTSFFAGAASTLHDHQEGPSIFYYAQKHLVCPAHRARKVSRYLPVPV